jgi:hypothetical protein
MEDNMRVVDRTGEKYGHLVVIKRSCSGSPKAMWECRCKCGTTIIAFGDNLHRGNTTSCGCSRAKHGLSKTKIYQVWRSMIQRCENPNNDAYKNYGGRGIHVSKGWHSFEKFFDDMGFPPQGGTLERKDNDGPYAKGNCRWATRREQALNKRSNTLVTAFGKTQSVSEWAREIKIAERTLHNRLFRAGLAPEEALTAKRFYQQRGNKCDDNH